MEKEVEKEFPGAQAVAVPTLQQVLEWFDVAQNVIPRQALQSQKRKHLPENWTIRTIADKLRAYKTIQQGDNNSSRKRRRLS